MPTFTAHEFSSYSYKVDPRTEEILPRIVDKDNHCIDAIRYALSRLIRGGDPVAQMLDAFGGR